MQSGSLVVVDGCRTVVFLQYVVSRGRPAPLDQACQSLVVCFLRSIDDRPSGLVDVVALERRWPSFWSRRRCFRRVVDSTKLEVLRSVRSPILEECSLCSFIRCAVCRS